MTDLKKIPVIPLRERDNHEYPFMQAVHETRIPMVITDPHLEDNPIIFANKAFLELVGYEEHEIIGRNCRFLQGPDTDRAVVERIRAGLAREEEVSVELINYRRDGTPFWNRLFISPVHHEGRLLYFFGSQLDITDRRRAEERLHQCQAEAERKVAERTQALEHALSSREMLLRELQHRVKNNLQLMASIITLQAARTQDAGAREGYRDLRNRVEALELVYRQLYFAEQTSSVELGTYLAQICANLARFYDPEHRIRLSITTESAYMTLDQALPIGLLVNELVVNCFKHGFPDRRPGEICLELRRVGPQRLALTVKDDGIGLPEGMDYHTQGNLGLIIVRNLVLQIGADMEVTSGPGTRVSLEFDSVLRSPAELEPVLEPPGISAGGRQAGAVLSPSASPVGG